MSRAGNKKRAGKHIAHKRRLPYESRRRPRPDDYDRVREWEAADEQARWDEAQDEALQASADRFDHSEDVP